MTDFWWSVFEIVINIFQAVACTMFVWRVLECKYTGKKSLIFFGLCSFSFFAAVTAFNYITFFEGASIFIYAAILFIYALFVMQGPIFKKALVSIIPISCLAIVTTVAMNLTSILFSQDLLTLMQLSSIFRLFFILLTNIFLVVSLYAVSLLFNRNAIILKASEWILIGAVLAISILIFIVLYMAVFTGMSDTAVTYIALAELLVVIIACTVYFLLVQLSKKHRIETEHTLLQQEYDFQQRSADEVKKQYETLQKARHDFNNTLRVIQTLSDENDAKKVNEYISSYLEQQKGSVRIIRTDNEYVNAIINSKLSEAAAANIEVLVNTVSDLESQSNVDLCNMLGNMFDNAIEACKKAESDRLIRLDISKENGNLIICMKNTITHSVLQSNPQLKTAKSDKRSHGYGTRIIRDLAQKHHGFADFYEDGGMFCCRTELVP